jgi:hypothetical protein
MMDEKGWEGSKRREFRRYQGETPRTRTRTIWGEVRVKRQTLSGLRVRAPHEHRLSR